MTTAAPDVPFEMLRGHPSSAVVLYVPHASNAIPADVRARIVLDDAALDVELSRMTDRHTDALAARAVALSGAPRPWTLLIQRSRLVVDPERFPDEREEMEAVGMGAVYTRTSEGRLLRQDDPVHRANLLARYFEPYAQTFADLVDQRLEATGRTIILDLHSYPRDPLPYELHADEGRPAICLGTDARHTPPWLVDAGRQAFAPIGEVAVNEPFQGTYVPLRHLGADDRVTSMMLEIRRDLLPAAEGREFESLARCLADLLRATEPVAASGPS